MATTNLFDYMVFPTQQSREKAKKQYFDTQKLFLNIQPYLTLNNLSENITVNDIFIDSVFEVINNDLREKIRRYNNDIIYLTLSLMKMWNYYDLLKKTSGEEKEINEILFRREARCVCCEIFMYEEKIKNLTRQIFNLKSDKTRHLNDLINEMKKIKDTTDYIKSYCEIGKQYLNYSYVKFVKKIRNDEIHNNSRLDEYSDTIKLADGSIATCSAFYAISNYELYNNIRQTLEAQLVLKESLQNILNNHRIEAEF